MFRVEHRKGHARSTIHVESTWESPNTYTETIKSRVYSSNHKISWSEYATGKWDQRPALLPGPVNSSWCRQVDYRLINRWIHPDGNSQRRRTDCWESPRSFRVISTRWIKSTRYSGPKKTRPQNGRRVSCKQGAAGGETPGAIPEGKPKWAIPPALNFSDGVGRVRGWAGHRDIYFRREMADGDYKVPVVEL